MPDAGKTTRSLRRRKGLMVTCGIVLALAVSFCGWVYKAKTQRELNRQLLEAVRNGDTKEARSLLKRGAEPNIRNVPEEPLSLWQQIQHVFRKDSQPSDDQNASLLEMAMHSDSEDTSQSVNVALIKTLLEAGAHPDDNSEGHVTPLMIAVQYDSPQTVQMLLNHGANPLAKDDSGKCPIHFLDSDDSDGFKIVEMLLEHGSDINAVDNHGETALLLHCTYGKIHMLRFLIAHGAKADVRDKDDNTPLILCFLTLLLSSSRRTDMVKLLIAHGADVNQRNILGGTPLSLAKRKKDQQGIRLLEAAGAKH